VNMIMLDICFNFPSLTFCLPLVSIHFYFSPLSLLDNAITNSNALGCFFAD
jgi:hypothetical protein